MIKCWTESAYGKRLIWAADSESVAHPGGDSMKGTVYVAGNSFCWVKPGPGAGAKPSWLPVIPPVKFHCLKVPNLQSRAVGWGLRVETRRLWGASHIQTTVKSRASVLFRKEKK